MDRQRAPRFSAFPRFSTFQGVQLSVLGDPGGSFPAHLIRLSGRGLRLVLDERVAVNSMVRVDAAEWAAFGEVCYCVHESSHYTVGLILDQVLINPVEIPAISVG